MDRPPHDIARLILDRLDFIPVVGVVNRWWSETVRNHPDMEFWRSQDVAFVTLNMTDRFLRALTALSDHARLHRPAHATFGQFFPGAVTGFFDRHGDEATARVLAFALSRISRVGDVLYHIGFHRGVQSTRVVKTMARACGNMWMVSVIEDSTKSMTCRCTWCDRGG